LPGQEFRTLGAKRRSVCFSALRKVSESSTRLLGVQLAGGIYKAVIPDLFAVLQFHHLRFLSCRSAHGCGSQVAT
jgi:hypothetical protein